ncbi:RNA methyltransferase [Bacillaceae bacterium]
MKTEVIESPHNAKIKAWSRLLTRKGREEQRSFLIEGVRLVAEALRTPGVEVTHFLYDKDEAVSSHPLVSLIEQKRNLTVVRVSAAALRKLTDTQTPQGVVAIVKKPAYSLDRLLRKEELILLLVDAVQDPGNLGTIVRAADAAGIDGIVLGEGCVDLYHPKVVRSTMGSLFHLPVVSGDLREVIPRLKKERVRILGTSLEAAVPYDRADYGGKIALVVGNEANGVHPEVLRYADEKVKIPIYGKAESLNVAMATSILLYEARRQRQR